MKKIEVYVNEMDDYWVHYVDSGDNGSGGISSDSEDEMLCDDFTPVTCGDIIGDFTGTDIIRDTLRIVFCHFEPNFVTSSRSPVLSTMCALNGFRTITIKVTPMSRKKISIGERGWWTQKEPITLNLERVERAFRDAMEPTLGPATSRDECVGMYLEFHPREHVPAMLRAQAQKLLLDADRVEQGGC